MSQNFEIIEDITCADIAFKAWGNDFDQLFAAAARAVNAIMLDNPESIRPVQEKTMNGECNAPDLLLYAFLQELVFYKDAESLLLVPVAIRVGTNAGKYRYEARLVGEPVDHKRHVFAVDIKAITLHRLTVQKRRMRWEALVVVDV